MNMNCVCEKFELSGIHGERSRPIRAAGLMVMHAIQARSITIACSLHAAQMWLGSEPGGLRDGSAKLT
jgi:hypothetical protein